MVPEDLLNSLKQSNKNVLGLTELSQIIDDVIWAFGESSMVKIWEP